jgi:hypothetical protein
LWNEVEFIQVRTLAHENHENQASSKVLAVPLLLNACRRTASCCCGFILSLARSLTVITDSWHWQVREAELLRLAMDACDRLQQTTSAQQSLEDRNRKLTDELAAAKAALAGLEASHLASQRRGCGNCQLVREAGSRVTEELTSLHAKNVHACTRQEMTVRRLR